jgi:5-methyltetrahydrofolate--homocysteine methyltransferase
MKQTTILDLARERSVIFDGASGSNLQRLELADDDFGGKEGCNEVLVRTRPDVVRALHDRFFAAGCHVVETNSFGATRVVLGEYGLAAEAEDLNRRAAELAREVAHGWSRPDRPRFVAGSMGPGTKLPSLGHIGFDELVVAYREQVAGLLAGGVDLLVVETCQDLLQTRAALYAIRRELERAGRGVPVLVSLTMELSGTMLLGSELGAALAALLPLRPDFVGLNCATGPLEMKQHLAFLSRACPLPLAAQPNAGLPENVGGRPLYPLSPEEFARWHESFIREEGVRLVGGCCGTTPEHIRALVARVDGLEPAARAPAWEPSLSSLYSAQPLAQQPPPFLVGERTNANGSKKFRELLLAERYDDLVELARDQERGGAHALDLCTAYVGRDEVRDTREAVTRFVRQVRLPLVIDSTQPEVMEAALKLCAGRSLLNSINLEEGESKARTVLALARDFGAAVVALAIDEQGMAREPERKLAVAERIYRLATAEHGLAASDLVFDMLTFTVGSGDQTLRDSARATLEAIRALKARLPGVHTILGVSNVSFGLKPAARRVLNSVFLHLAVEHGLDLAIVDASKILPLARVDERARSLALDLLLDRRRGDGHDPLHAYLEHFEGARAAPAAAEATQDARTLAERIAQRVIDGERADLELLLASALTRQRPLAIINEILIPAMRVVGDLFGAGQMQLPFVLQSAEVMKQAVSFLEPHLERREDAAPGGTLVLATVRGDVHDIGKNLVDILLSNNGFRVLNLGIKVPAEEMIRVFEAERADAIGMSGLLVKSTLVMKENLLELKRRGLSPPVLLGGAALTRRYVEEDLRAIYGPTVAYGKDAFEGLALMREVALRRAGGPVTRSERAPANITAQLRAAEAAAPAAPFHHPPEGLVGCEVPRAPFFGSRLLEPSLEEVLSLVSETTLFRGQWQYRRGKLDAERYARLIEEEVRPAFERLKESVAREQLLRPRAVYGYHPCYAQPERNELVLLDAGGARELARFRFPRQHKPPYHCIADFFRAAGDGRDVLAFFVATIGDEASRRCAALFESHRYRDYLHLHGLAVESAEAAAEAVHRHIRRELGIAGDDAQRAEDLAQQRYRGSRYSFGYPACPELEEQRKLFALLEPERIGVTLTESAQMVPEQSVSAFVVHHPSAKYFTT